MSQYPQTGTPRRVLPCLGNQAHSLSHGDASFLTRAITSVTLKQRRRLPSATSWPNHVGLLPEHQSSTTLKIYSVRSVSYGFQAVLTLLRSFTVLSRAQSWPAIRKATRRCSCLWVASACGAKRRCHSLTFAFPNCRSMSTSSSFIPTSKRSTTRLRRKRRGPSTCTRTTLAIRRLPPHTAISSRFFYA